MRRGVARERILQAARAEFGTHGFAGGRVDRIARKAGVNKQLLYYYFGSKAQLFQAALQPRPAMPSGHPIAEPFSTPDDFRLAMQRLFTELQTRPELVAALVDRDPEPGRSATQWAAGLIEALGSLVSAGQGLGYFRDDVDPALIARQAIVLSVGFFALASHVATDADAWRRAAGDTLLRAIAW